MHRLLYISTSRAPITPALLDDILRVSRRNNVDSGVTGLLIAGGSRFLQVLEGEADSVHATYRRIAADPRHFASVILHDAAVDARTFGAWAMGSIVAGDAPAAMNTHRAVDALLAPITDPVIRGYFDGFVAVKRAA